MDRTSRDRDAVLAFGERTLRESFAALEPLGSGKILKKGEADYVTASDYAFERIISQRIKQQFPSDVIISEETRNGQPDGAWVWLLDPLDGTVNYVSSIPLFAISLALLHDHDLYAGWVYDPLRYGLFFGAERQWSNIEWEVAKD